MLTHAMHATIQFEAAERRLQAAQHREVNLMRKARRTEARLARKARGRKRSSIPRPVGRPAAAR